FFSSRRRHTRSLRDWSSDVCSSDLPAHLTDFTGYFAAIERSRISVNLLSYVGLGQVRRVVMDSEQRAPTGAELRKMTTIVADVKIGRAACRERGSFSGVRVEVKKGI